MKIEIKIRDKETKIWSLPVPIDDFIVRPGDIEFEWEDGSTLPYNDFLYFGGDYEYCEFIDGMILSDYVKHIKNLEEYKNMYDDLCN